MRRCPVRTDKLCADVSNAAQTSPPSESSAIALGSFGTTAPPRIVRFAASDPVGRDLAYGAGDFFEIEFDMATTRARDEGGRDYLDTLFAFTSMEQVRVRARVRFRVNVRVRVRVRARARVRVRVRVTQP